MSTKRTTITNEGISFMKSIASKYGSNGLIGGTNKFPIPYSTETVATFHSANALDKDGKTITTNNQLITSLIFWINKYSKQFDLDPNIISAQCFEESTYRLWTYSSAAFGLPQFTIPTLFDIVIKNNKEIFSETEINKIILNLNNIGTYGSYNLSSIYYTEKDNPIDKEISINNRIQLYQNIIDNPEIMIKAQCSLMSEISDKNSDFASNSLFAYNVGSMLYGNDYYEIVNKQIKNSGISSTNKIYEFEKPK